MYFLQNEKCTFCRLRAHWKARMPEMMTSRNGQNRKMVKTELSYTINIQTGQRTPKEISTADLCAPLWLQPVFWAITVIFMALLRHRKPAPMPTSTHSSKVTSSKNSNILRLL